MKEPRFGSNKIQSFIELETTKGKVRWGLEGPENRIFLETSTGKVYLTDENGYMASDVINEVTAGNGVRLDGVILKDGTVKAHTPLLRTGFTTVSIVEYGDGIDMTSVLTLTGFAIGTIPAAAAALAVGAVVAYFPSAGIHVEDIYCQSLSLTLPGTVVNADVGLGSLVASGAQQLLSSVGATAEDRLTGQTVPTAVGGGAVTTALVRSSAAGISLNLAASVKDIFLNAAGLFCAQSANLCMYGSTDSSTGKNAAPMPSLVSAILFLKIAILPAAASA